MGNNALTERGMVKRAIPGIYPALSISRDHFRTAKELTVGKSIADIVLYKFSQASNWPAAPLSAVESVVLSIVRLRNSVRLETIARHAYMSVDDVESVVKGRLSNWDLLRFNKRGTVLAMRDWVEQSELIAIEAKLTKWREALDQAIDYKNYSDRSFVLLPHFCVNAAIAHKNEFTKVGVGLLSYSPNSVELIIDAKSSMRHPWHREYALSRLNKRPKRGTAGARRINSTHSPT